MRVKLLLVLLGLGLVLPLLVGCNNDDETAFTVGGTITNQGVPQGAATVALLQNGTVVRTAVNTNIAGQFNFTDLPAGTYTIAVTNNGVTTLYGPVTVTNQNVNIASIESPTPATLPAGVLPTLTTASLVAFGIDQSGTLVPVRAQINALAPTAAGNPVVLNGITPTTAPVTITNAATGQAVTFPAVTFTANQVTIIRATFPVVQQFTISGTLTNNAGTALGAGNTVTLLSNGTAISSATSLATGAFTLSNVNPGTFALQFTGPNNVTTIVAPATVSGQNITQNIAAPTTAELNALGIATPPTGTAALVVFVTDTLGAPKAATVTINTTPPLTANSSLTAPAVIQGILTTGPFTVTISTLGGTPLLSIPGVTFSNAAFTVIRAIVPVGAL